MADPQQRAQAGTPFRPSASAWNRMLDAAKAFEAGAGLPGGAAVPHCLVRVRNDTGGDLAAFSVLKLGASVLDVTVPMRVAPAPMFAGTTPAAATDTFCVLIEPAPDGKFALAAVAGVVPVEVNVTDAGHGYATPTAASAARLTSAASGPARILDRESGTGNVAAAVLLEGTAGGGTPTVYHATADLAALGFDAVALPADIYASAATVTVPAGSTVLALATLWYQGVTDSTVDVGFGTWQASGSVPARPDLYGATRLAAFLGATNDTNIMMPVQAVFTVGSSGGDQSIGVFKYTAGAATVRVISIAAIPVAVG